MNSNELKKILKPLIKECIKEVVFEDKFLSNIISETVNGLTRSRSEPILETRQIKPNNLNRLKEPIFSEEELDRDRFLGETRKKMAQKVSSKVDVFEGLEPLHEARTKSQLASPTSKTPPALSSWAPDDPGVDISKFYKGGR